MEIIRVWSFLPGDRHSANVPTRAEESEVLDSMRVLYVNDLAFIVDTLASALSDRGVESRVIGREISGPPFMGSTFIRNAISIQRSLVRARNFDILHLNYGLFGFFAFETEKPKILHCHGSDVRPGNNLKTRISNLVTRHSMNAVDRVWYATTDLYSYFRNSDVPFRYMPNPVSADFFASSRPPPTSPRVLFAMPLTYLKGADVAIEAMRILTQRHLGAEIGTFSYPVVQRESVHLRQRIPAGVIGIPWTQHSEMPHLMMKASVVIGRLRLGSLGITELEAMASGRPLIVQQHGSVQGRDGYYESDPPVISCSTPLEVADAVQECLTNESFARDIGSRARQWALKYHAPGVVADQYVREYRELCEASAFAG